jgi:hypothetical protein
LGASGGAATRDGSLGDDTATLLDPTLSCGSASWVDTRAASPGADEARPGGALASLARRGGTRVGMNGDPLESRPEAIGLLDREPLASLL